MSEYDELRQLIDLASNAREQLEEAQAQIAVLLIQGRWIGEGFPEVGQVVDVITDYSLFTDVRYWPKEEPGPKEWTVGPLSTKRDRFWINQDKVIAWKKSA